MTEHRTQRHKFFIEQVQSHFKELLEEPAFSMTTVYAWRKGAAIPSLDNVDRVAEILGCTRDEIVYWEAKKRG